MKKAILFISTLLALGMLSTYGAGEQANETAANSVPAEPAKSDLTAPQRAVSGFCLYPGPAAPRGAHFRFTQFFNGGTAANL